jgi:hypothetical protein
MIKITLLEPLNKFLRFRIFQHRQPLVFSITRIQLILNNHSLKITMVMERLLSGTQVMLQRLERTLSKLLGFVSA